MFRGLKDDDKRKAALRKDLSEWLRTLGAAYEKSVNKETHSLKILKLATDLTESHKNSGVLRDHRFRIGIAQKALNLYLKYLWCLGEIAPPPHCPLDRKIIDKLDLERSGTKKYNWTTLDDIEEYKYLIEKCREKAKEAGNLSLAEWELNEWTPY